MYYFWYVIRLVFLIQTCFPGPNNPPSYPIFFKDLHTLLPKSISPQQTSKSDSEQQILVDVFFSLFFILFFVSVAHTHTHSPAWNALGRGTSDRPHGMALYFSLQPSPLDLFLGLIHSISFFCPAIFLCSCCWFAENVGVGGLQMGSNACACISEQCNRPHFLRLNTLHFVIRNIYSLKMYKGNKYIYIDNSCNYIIIYYYLTIVEVWSWPFNTYKKM